jgi:hypothetical protein
MTAFQIIGKVAAADPAAGVLPATQDPDARALPRFCLRLCSDVGEQCTPQNPNAGASKLLSLVSQPSLNSE